jgi:hypothetical protein
MFGLDVREGEDLVVPFWVSVVAFEDDRFAVFDAGGFQLVPEIHTLLVDIHALSSDKREAQGNYIVVAERLQVDGALNAAFRIECSLHHFEPEVSSSVRNTVE